MDAVLTIEFEVHWSATPMMGLLLPIPMAPTQEDTFRPENAPKHTIKPLLLCLLWVAPV